MLSNPLRKRARIGFAKYIQKNNEQICLIQNLECSETIIRAHSIQNNVILDNLSEDGHVYMLDFYNGETSLRKIGRNEASTFRGLCSYHDNKLFKSIDFEDNCEFDKPNQEQVTAFFLRNICLELWKKKNSSKNLEDILQMLKNKDFLLLKEKLLIDENTSRETDITHLRLYKTGADNASIVLKKHLIACLINLQRKRFNSYEYFHYTFPYKINFAVSSGFSPIFEFNNKPLFKNPTLSNQIDLSLNIFSINNTTHIIFISHKKNKNIFNFEFIEPFKKLNEIEKQILLSNLVLSNCENIVYSPRFINSKSSDTLKKITDYAVDTALNIQYDYKLPNINLFT